MVVNACVMMKKIFIQICLNYPEYSEYGNGKRRLFLETLYALDYGRLEKFIGLTMYWVG